MDARKLKPIPTSTVAKASILDRDIELFSSKGLSDKDKADFFQQTSALLKAGVDLLSTLNQLQDVESSKKKKHLLLQVVKALISGKSLSVSLEETGSFDVYEVVSIEVGEAAGKLETTLDELHHYFAGKVELRKQIISALSYPLLIFFSTIGAVMFMIFFVIPIFEDVFIQFGGDLPFVTQKVIDFSKSFNDAAGYYFAGLIVVIVSFRAFATSKSTKPHVDRLVLKIPFYGKYIEFLLKARFCGSLSLLLNSNVTLMHSIELNIKMQTNSVFKEALKEVRNSLLKGKSLYESVSGNSFFEPYFAMIIKVGEESSNLPSFFQQLSLTYSDKIKTSTQTLNTVLEPALIIFLGLFVGLILVSMYLPMFDLSSQMSF